MESLSSLLQDLQDLDLTGEIDNESAFLKAHGGYCDVFWGNSRRHGGMQVAIKRLRVHVLESWEAAKVRMDDLLFISFGLMDFSLFEEN